MTPFVTCDPFCDLTPFVTPFATRVTGEVNGAKAHAQAAIENGLTVNQLVEGFVIAVMVTGITTMCKAGVEAVKAAKAKAEELEKK